MKNTKVELYQVVEAILYRLKTGCHLNKYKHFLDMSSIQLDGTPVKRGGQAVTCQGRKKSKTSNMLILNNNRVAPLVCSNPVEGNHNDAFKAIMVRFITNAVHWKALNLIAFCVILLHQL